ncbi:hypothetical protein GBW32_31205 [Streptomyces tsukubensis]|nr:hypothetical protein GBW32_31205 [Streptomyces tsukubensis]
MQGYDTPAGADSPRAGPMPKGMRLIVREELSDPGVQLRFAELGGLRLTCFAAITKGAQLAEASGAGTGFAGRQAAASRSVAVWMRSRAEALPPARLHPVSRSRTHDRGCPAVVHALRPTP